MFSDNKDNVVDIWVGKKLVGYPPLFDRMSLKNIQSKN